MNRPIRKVAMFLGVLLIAIFANLNYVQVIKGNSYRNNPDNRRGLLIEYSSPRGQIVVQGSAIAKSVATKDELKYLRTYPNGSDPQTPLAQVYAPITGFISFIYGRDGLESAENDVLSGDDPRQFGSKIADLFTGRNPRGGSIELTINKAAQLAAYNAMRGPNGVMRRGAVVALDPQTGAILAAVSTPSYDPNQLSSHDSAAMQKYWEAEQVNKNPADPMLNRAFNQLYAPGSVFKVIVSAAALQHENLHPNSVVPAPNAYWPLGGSGPCPASGAACVENFEGETCQNGTTAPLIFAFAKSCNTAFSQLAVQKIGGSVLAQQAKAFGLDGDDLTTPLDVARSTVGTSTDLSDKAALAQTAFGQRDVRITPLQGAMLAAAVANGGALMKPYLVQRELNSSLSVLKVADPQKLSQAVEADADVELQQMMEAVVTAPEGTGGSAAIKDISGIVVGGKTGTADTGIFSHGKQTPPHAWFVGFALQNGDPRIAVAVIIENGGVNGSETTGGLAAAPVARAVMEAYLRSVPGR